MKKTLAVILTVVCLFGMTACSSGAGSEAVPAQQEQATESSFMASGDSESSEAQEKDAQSEAIESAEKPVAEQGAEQEPFQVPEIDDMDRGTSFWFNRNDEGLIITYDGSGNEYLVAKFNQAEDPSQAFHDLYGYHTIYSNGNEASYRDFYYTTMSEVFGNAIRYVNLDERIDEYVCPGWLHENVAMGPFEGNLLVQIEEGDGDGTLKPGIYMFDANGVMQEFFGDSYDPVYLRTGQYEEKETSVPEPQPQPEPQLEPEAPSESEPESELEKPIVVSESDDLFVNEVYEFDLSGDGVVDTFMLASDEEEGVIMIVNGEIRELSEIDPYLMSHSYRIVDLNPAAKGKDLEILEAAPPYDQNIHFVGVKSLGNRDDVQVVGPLTVAYDDYENDRVLYQGNDQILVIETSSIVTAFYQKFYKIEHGMIKDMSRPDITKYMSPLRTTMNKNMWVFTEPKISEDTKFYLHAGDEIIIHGEHEGNLWIEYLGECSSDFYWMMGSTIQHFPDSNGMYLFNGVQFWS